MKMPRCKSRLCLLVCGWLWISGLLLMGKILASLGRFTPESSLTASNTDAVGSLQIFFLFYTGACAGLFILWNKQAAANGKVNSPGI